MLVGIGGGLIGITILVVVIFLAGNIRKYFENASISIDEPDEGFEMETLPAGEPTEFIISPTQTAGIIPTNQVEIPTSNPATAETASYKNIFAHDFNDKEGIEGWEDMPAAESYHGEIDPENSTFQIFIDKPNTMAYFSFGESIMPRTSRDILLTAVFLPPVSSEGEFGLLCRVNKDLGGYYVGVVPLLNQYSMGRFYLNGGGQDALRSNGPNISAYPFTQGDINSMTLWCIGNQIMFSLNGNVIDEFRDTTFDSGTAALYAYLKDSPSGQRYWTTFDFVMIDIPAY